MNTVYKSPQLNKLTIIGGAVGLILLIVLFKSFVTIHSGEAGVLYERFNGGVNTEEVLGEGFHLVAPWNQVFVYEVRQQEAHENMAVLSSNGLEIALDLSLWFKPANADLGFLHKTKGENYLDRVVKPAARSATRSVVGRYTPEQIYSSKRDVIQEEIYLETKKILDKQYVQLNEVLVRDVTLPTTIKEAIERKLKQEQESLEYEFRLQKATKEAEKQKIEAEGKAAANRILNASLTDKILKEKGIQATLELAKSPNAKTVVIGSGKSGLPLILNQN
ncbi:MAG: prohibitin family protein [Bacteroidetes bacterium]|jgi:prohibitin 1|nr:prohibitin family protein [Bacteroidota bacterium]